MANILQTRIPPKIRSQIVSWKEAWLRNSKEQNMKMANQIIGVLPRILRHIDHVDRQCAILETRLSAADEIAFDDSLGTLEGQCVTIGEGQICWYDTKDTAAGTTRFVERAVKYLEGRGLLIHHKTNPDLVRPKAIPGK
jgi:hypothetical protein